LEGAAPTTKTQVHLDRCLTCRACETTCPSGVEFGRLLDIGRQLVAEQVPRPPRARLLRAALRSGVSGRMFGPLLGLARALGPLLPPALRSKLPARARTARSGSAQPVVAGAQRRRMLLLPVCVQPALAPNINAATLRVFAALGIELLPRSAGCCGAIRHHLDDQEGAREAARRNIDDWWPQIEAGCEAVVVNASGCGAMIREYAHLLRGDAQYAEKAARVSSLLRDVAEIVPAQLPLLQQRLRTTPAQRVVFHPPCTLQHAMKVRGSVEALLSACGAQPLAFAEGHLCCGSAGTYSLLQPELATALRDRKLAALMEARPDLILSANIGCITHLATAAQVPVQHWIEWLDTRLASTAEAG
jgi:glycolate oxidase iron-sulfur subunit